MKSSKDINDISVKKLDFSKTSKQFSLGNSNLNVNQNENLEKLEKKVDDIYDYVSNLEGKIQTPDKNVKNIELDSLNNLTNEISEIKNLINDQNEKIMKMDVQINKNLENYKSKEEQAKLLKDGIEESFAKLISIKNSESPDLTELKQSHLQLDVLTKTNQYDIKNLKNDIDDIVKKSIDKNIEGTILNRVDSKLLENSSKIEDILNKSLENLSSKIENKIKSLDNKFESILANQVVVNDKVEESVAEESVVDESVVEESVVEESVVEESVVEEPVVEEPVVEESIVEESIVEESVNVNSKELIKFRNLILNNEIKVYPNSGYTLYIYVDNINYGIDDKASLSVIIDGEVRGITTEFIRHDGKTFTSINVNVKEDGEKIENLILISVNQLFVQAKDYNLNKLNIGENNLENYPDLPYIHFIPS